MISVDPSRHYAVYIRFMSLRNALLAVLLRSLAQLLQRRWAIGNGAALAVVCVVLLVLLGAREADLAGGSTAFRGPTVLAMRRAIAGGRERPCGLAVVGSWRSFATPPPITVFCGRAATIRHTV